MSDLRIIGEGQYNGDMLRMGIALRGMSGREVANATGIPQRAVYAYMGGKQPTEAHMDSLVEVLELPRPFFFRDGDFPERDERYPLDMYVAKSKKPSITRERLVELLTLVPDDEIPALHAYMHEIAQYADNVVRISEMPT